MKTIRISILLAISSCFTYNVNAQQTPLFGFNSQLLNISNPSLTKNNTPVNVTLAGRKYWTGIQGSPEAYIGSFSFSPNDYKSAFGGFLWSEKAPLLSKQVIGLNYAYAIKNMDENNNLRFGAGLDFVSISSNNASILTPDYADPYYTALFNNSKSSVDFRAGATWNGSGLEIGLAMQQLIKSKNTIGETVNGKLVFNNPLITNGHIKYTINRGEDVKITPMVFWQVQKAIPLRVDINLLAEKTGKVWGGAWFRPNSAVGFMGGLWILPDVKIGYMYEKSFFKKLTTLGNSHELLITYSPSGKVKEKINKDKYESNEPIKMVEKPEPEIIRVIDTIVIVKEIRIIETAKTAPVEPTTPKTIPKTTPTAKSITGNFYIITGLYSLESNAKLLIKKLEADGYKGSIVKKPDTNQFYVSIGNFNTSDAAHNYMTNHPNSKYTFWVKEIK